MSVLDSLDDRFFREVFVEHIYPVIPEAKIVFDIGSLALEYSILVYPFASQIVALEPHPTHAEKIRQAITKHHLDIKIRFYELALANEDGVRRFGKLDDYGGSAFSKDETGLEVKAISMNSLMESTLVDHVDVMKMDVEGAEKEILSDNFPYEKVHNIFFEVHTGIDAGIFNYLNSKGYETRMTREHICIAQRRS